MLINGISSILQERLWGKGIKYVGDNGTHIVLEVDGEQTTIPRDTFLFSVLEWITDNNIIVSMSIEKGKYNIYLYDTQATFDVPIFRARESSREVGIILAAEYVASEVLRSSNG